VRVGFRPNWLSYSHAKDELIALGAAVGNDAEPVALVEICIRRSATARPSRSGARV
jgi:hypothetical protein